MGMKEILSAGAVTAMATVGNAREDCTYRAIVPGTYDPATDQNTETVTETTIKALVYKGKDTKNGKDPEAIATFVLFESATYPGISPSVNDQINVLTGKYAGLYEVVENYGVPSDPVWKLKVRLP